MELTNEDLQYYTCDQIAECIDGVSKELYKALWDITCHLEDRGLEHREDRELRLWFHMLSEDMQQEVNSLKDRF